MNARPPPPDLYVTTEWGEGAPSLRRPPKPPRGPWLVIALAVLVWLAALAAAVWGAFK